MKNNRKLSKEEVNKQKELKKRLEQKFKNLEAEGLEEIKLYHNLEAEGLEKIKQYRNLEEEGLKKKQRNLSEESLQKVLQKHEWLKTHNAEEGIKHHHKDLKPETQPKKVHPILKILKNPKSFRQAFLINEILKPIDFE